MAPFQAWNGLLAGKRPWRARLVAKAALRPSTSGTSGAWLCRASDGNEYWVKTLNNCQGIRVPTTEQVVGRAGALIGAPTCHVEVIFIPSDLVGWEFRTGKRLERGFAHASNDVPNVVLVGGLGDRAHDDNSVRHVGYYALHDWCWGGDTQGLEALNDGRKFYSHDHGCFLPPNNFTWDIAQLQKEVDVAHNLPIDGGGLDMIEVERVATRLAVYPIS
jgi:hypothetical protein